MIILVTNVFGFSNKGDWVLFDSLLRLLEESFPGCDVHGVCRDPAKQSEYFPSVKWHKQFGTSDKNGVFRRIENVAGCGLAVLADYLPLHIISQECSDTHNIFKNAELIVACPGGYLEDSNPSIITNLLHLNIALKNSCPLIIAPQSIGPIRSKFWIKHTASVLSKTYMNCVRDISSLNQLESIGVPNNKIKSLPDMAFSIGSLERVDIEDILNNFDLNTYGFYSATLIDWYFPFSKDSGSSRNAYEYKISKTFRELYKKTGKPTVLLSQIESSKGVFGDMEVIKRVSDLSGEATIVCDEILSPIRMISLISSSEGFIGSRLHSCIFSISTATPTVALSYLPKTWDIFSQLGLENCVFDIDEFNETLLVNVFLESLIKKEKFVKAKNDMEVLGEFGRNELSRILKESVR